MRKVKLDDVLVYEQPTKYIVESEDYNEDYETPVLTAGKSFLLGYSNEKSGIFSDVPVIIFDDFTTSIKFVDFPFKVKSSALKILRANKDLADIRYLFYKMQTIKINCSEHKRYWISKYSQIQIDLPPLTVQQKIASILDAADEYRQKTKALVDKYDQLARSLFLDVFGDPVKGAKYIRKQFKDISKVRQGLQIPISERKKEAGLNRFPYITNQFLNGGKIAEYIENPRKSVVCKKDDVLMTRTGNTGIVLSDVEGVFHNNFFLIDYDRNQINRLYLVFFLKHPQIKALVLKKASTTTIPDLNHSEFYKITLPVPPLSIQNQFAERIQIIESQKQQVQAILQKAEELFESLLQKAFNGELISNQSNPNRQYMDDFAIVK